MIDISEQIREKYAGMNVVMCNPLLRGALSLRTYIIFEGYFDYPTYICSTVQEIFHKGEELNLFNVLLFNVIYQKLNGEKYKFQLSDGLTRIDAYEFFPSFLPWRHIQKKLIYGEKINLAGRFNNNKIDVFQYEKSEPRKEKVPQLSELEIECPVL